MDSVRLSFCTIYPLAPNLDEVIVDDGIEIDLAMVEEYHAYFARAHATPFSLLINKRHAYTYTFEAQQQIANVPNIQAMAVLVYRKASEAATNALIRMPREVAWNIRIYYDRQSALDWLNEFEASALPPS